MQKVKLSVQKLVDKVSVTYGPSEGKVFVYDEYGGNTYDDGLKIARAFKLDDPFENAIVSFVVNGMNETNLEVGDGSTTFPILVNALLNCGQVEIREALGEAIEQLKSKSKEVTTIEELEKVAFTSFKNKELSKLIAQIVWETGKDGEVTIEETKEMGIEKSKGMIFDWTFEIPQFINTNKGKSEIDNPHILVSQKKISNLQEILAILEFHKTIVIIGEVEGDAFSTILNNKLQGRLHVNIIKPYGDTFDVMQDICAVTGATLITDGMQIHPEHLGKAKKVISDRKKTTIIDGAGDPTQRISETTDKKRLASMNSNIGIVKITSSTTKELISLREKVEDSINATQQALRHGTVKGGALAFKEIKTKSTSFNKALGEPRKVLEKNGKEYITEATDSTGVLLKVLENAVSIALELLSIKGEVDSRVKTVVK
jgi:chaperonin GroEL